jgi:hypothetical protein
VPYIGNADLDRPMPFDSGILYWSYGGGPFRLAPSRCGVATQPDGLAAFQLDIVRGLDQSSAVLSCELTAEYAGDAALAAARGASANASLTACVLTNWWFRVLPSAVLGAPVELTAPSMLAGNGLGSARILARLTLETGLVLESMLTGRAPLEGVAEAQFEGVSPRLSLAVRFNSAALLDDLLKHADASGALPRQAIVDYFSLDPSTLPLVLDGTVDGGSRLRFSEAMTDRLVARYGHYVPSQVMADAPVVQLDPSAPGSSMIWALSQPFLATRRVVMPVDLLAAAQAQVERLGPESVVRRLTSVSLPSLGHERVVALCNLPGSRSGVDALGVTLTFPPHPPDRPQAETVTAVFESADDMATIDVRLSPGEPLRYQYSPFAVLTDERGTRQIDGPWTEGEGSPLHLSTDRFPIEFAVIEVTPALAQLAVVAGVCSYEADGAVHEQKILFDSGNLSTAIAIPRNRTSLTIDGYAIARQGSGQLRFGPIESPQVRLDLTSFPGYGPQKVDIRCVFDDSATLHALSLLPMDREDTPDNVTTLSFTPAEPVRTFQWFSTSPFAPGLRYRAFLAPQSEWSEFRSGAALVVHSSQLHKQERMRARLETAEAGPAAPESAVDPAGISPEYDVTDQLLFTSVSDSTKKLYVPRYSVDVQTVSGQDRYRVSMAQHNTASTLEVNLVGTPAESLGEAARTATAYPHNVAVSLDFKVAAESGARKSLTFTEIARADNLVKASLTFATLAERDDVYRALTEQARDAKLVVQRSIDVKVPERPATGGIVPGSGVHGVPDSGPHSGLPQMYLPQRPVYTLKTIPLPDPPPPVLKTAVMVAPTPTLMLSSVAMRTRIERAPAAAREASPLLMTTLLSNNLVFHPIGRFVPSLPTPQLVCTGTADVNGDTRCGLSVVNWADFSDDFFGPSDDIRPSSRTWVNVVDADTGTRLYGFSTLSAAKQLNELWFPVSDGTPVPAHVHITITDRRANLTRTSNAVDTGTVARSAPATRDDRVHLDQAVAPTPFAFPPALHGYIFQGMTPGSGSNQLIRYRLSWKGTFYTYLQDASRPDTVFVFPDQFKVARRSDTPFSPFATVRVASRPDASDADVVFDYVVAPFTDPRRLEDARAQLLADARFGEDHVQFQPFLTSDVRFFVDRPTTTGSVREQRPDAAIVLQGWLKDTLTMPLGDFRLLFDAMHRRTASLFLGHVEIDVPDDATETVPFAARMDDLSGEVFSYPATSVADGVVKVMARNEIESPLSVQAIDAMVSWSGHRVHGLVQGSGLPTASLAPGATIQLNVTPEAPLPPNTTPEVEFMLTGVTAIPDPEAIWNSILDRTTVDYFKMVTVKAIATLFDPVAGREAERIVSILVEFENGGTAELTVTALDAKVRVDYPIDDVVLGRPVSSTYRYTVTVIRADGSQQRDATPRQGASSTFFVSVVR